MARKIVVLFQSTQIHQNLEETCEDMTSTDVQANLNDFEWGGVLLVVELVHHCDQHLIHKKSERLVERLNDANQPQRKVPGLFCAMPWRRRRTINDGSQSQDQK